MHNHFTRVAHHEARQAREQQRASAEAQSSRVHPAQPSDTIGGAFGGPIRAASPAAPPHPESSHRDAPAQGSSKPLYSGHGFVGIDPRCCYLYSLAVSSSPA